MIDCVGETLDALDEAALRRIVVDAAHHTLPRCGIRVDRESEDGECPRHVASRKALTTVLGFNGNDVRGMLTLMGPIALMRQAYPLPLPDEQSS